MTFQNVPVAFSWAGQSISAEAVQLSTVETRNGRLNIVLRYYEEPILDDEDSAANLRAEPVAEIVLLRDLYRFEWEVLDARQLDEWIYDWDVRGRLPLQLKLTVQFTPDEDVLEHYFWITPKASPELVMRSITSGQAGGRQGGGADGSGDGGNNQPGGTGGTPPAGGTPVPNIRTGGGNSGS
jgi:hypothetical protein